LALKHVITSLSTVLLSVEKHRGSNLIPDGILYKVYRGFPEFLQAHFGHINSPLRCDSLTYPHISTSNNLVVVIIRDIKVK